MIAVPQAFIVEGQGEEVARGELLQHLLAGHRVTGLQNCVAQRGTHARQDGGLQQEDLDGLGLAAQHLVGQVVQDMWVSPRKAGDELSNPLAVAALHRQCGELQACDPTLSTFLQHLDL